VWSSLGSGGSITFEFVGVDPYFFPDDVWSSCSIWWLKSDCQTGRGIEIEDEKIFVAMKILPFLVGWVWLLATAVQCHCAEFNNYCYQHASFHQTPSTTVSCTQTHNLQTKNIAVVNRHSIAIARVHSVHTKNAWMNANVVWQKVCLKYACEFLIIRHSHLFVCFMLFSVCCWFQMLQVPVLGHRRSMVVHCLQAMAVKTPRFSITVIQI